jgi:hypothetical protein
MGVVKMAIERVGKIFFDHGVEEIADARGKVLFDRNDLERCVQFQQTLKDRFARELAILDPNGLGSVKANPQLTLKNG